MNTSRAITALVTAIILSIATVPRSAHADETQPDNWGNTPDTRSPHPDAKGRSGHWWWPKTQLDSKTPLESLGNRGEIYGKVPTVTTQPATSAAVPPRIPTARSPKAICGGMGPNYILFQRDTSELKPEGIQEIQKLVAQLQKFPGDTLTCIGHTDDTGSESYNQQLGLRRAQTVVDRIVAAGVASNRVHAKSEGETHPIVPNDSPANRALNRRVDYKFDLSN